MTELSEVFGMNQYCGPSVLSALTGKSTDACAAVISRVSGRNVIKAVQVNHLIEAAKLLGMKVDRVPLVSRTLFGLLGALSKRDGYYIVLVPHHVIALEIKHPDIYLIDNHTKKAINAASSARLTQNVENVWQVIPKTREEIFREANEARKRWLVSRIADINNEIMRLMNEKSRLEEEMKEIDNAGTS